MGGGCRLDHVDAHLRSELSDGVYLQGSRLGVGKLYGQGTCGVSSI